MSLPLGHAIIGGAVLVTLGPRFRFCTPRWAIAAAMVLPAVPDMDFVLVWGLGLPSEVWHRGFSHSLTFALVGGVAAWIIVRWLGRPDARMAGILVATLLGSHGLLDACGEGLLGPGRGAQLWWPFSSEAVRWPWQFLPPAVNLRDPCRVVGIVVVEAWTLLPPCLLWCALVTAVRRSWHARATLDTS